MGKKAKNFFYIKVIQAFLGLSLIFVFYQNCAEQKFNQSLRQASRGELVAPFNLTYITNPAIYSVNTDITPNVPSFFGSSATLFSINPALPQGLIFDVKTGLITGRPAVVAIKRVYEVTVVNNMGSAKVNLEVTVNGPPIDPPPVDNTVPPAGITYPNEILTFTKGAAITPLVPSSGTGGIPTAYSLTDINGNAATLPAGLAFNAATGVILGTPTQALAQTSYYITASNSKGSFRVLNPLKITVALPKISISAAASANEGLPIAFTISLNAVSTQNIRFNFITRPGTALADIDFASARAEGVINAGSFSTVVSIQTLLRAGYYQGNVQFSVELTPSADVEISENNWGQGTILELDVPPPAIPTVTLRSENAIVLTRPPPFYDYAPSAMYDDDGKYKMWWCAGVSGDYIGYSESSTNDNFRNDLGQYYFPNRANGQIGSPTSTSYFDGIHACDPSVVKHRGEYYLYYGGGPYPTEHCMDGATYNADGTVATLAREPLDLNNCQTVILDLTKFPANNSTYSGQIGVAKSIDGVNWQRLNNGQPVVSTFANPAKALEFATKYGARALPDNKNTVPLTNNKINAYGVGQPSVIVKDNLFYMIYTDTTGVGRRFYDNGTSAGAGLYAIRSPDPLFQTEVEEVRCPGDEANLNSDYTDNINPGGCAQPYWRKLNVGEKPTTRYAVIETYSAELSYSDALNLFLIAFRNHPTDMQMFFFNENFKLIGPALSLGSAQYRDGPGLLRRNDGHLLPPQNLTANVCSEIPLVVYSAIGTDNASNLNPSVWDMGRWSATLQNSNSCSAAQIAKLYEGALISSPGRPLAYVTNGFKIYFELAPPAATLSQRAYSLSNEVFDQIPVGAEIYAGKNPDGSPKMKVVAATGLPASFIDQNRSNQRWQVQCMETIAANQSLIQSISVEQWYQNPFGGELFCNGVIKFNP